jgi:hypothetical protein
MNDDTALLDAALAALRAGAASLVPAAPIAARVVARIEAQIDAARAVNPRERGEVLRLIDVIARDRGAQSRLGATPTQSAFLHAFVQIGGERGIVFSAAAAGRVLSALNAQNDEGELSDDQLEAVAGGASQTLRELWKLFAGLP